MQKEPTKMKPNALLIVIFIGRLATAAADTFTVTNTETSGAGSFAQAITNANGHPNIDVNTPDRIEFAIPTSDPNRDPSTGVFTIAPPSAGLPGITDSVIIDGYTQSGAKANTLATGNNAVLLIELSGVNAGSGVSGLNFKAGSAGSTVRGMVINRFANTNGFAAAGITINSNEITVLGNFIGTDPAGATALGNAAGIFSGGFVPGGNRIGSPLPGDRNVISGNIDPLTGSGSGLAFTNGSEGDTVQNNYIGVNAAGNSALPNFIGIALSGLFGGTTLGEIVIGGALAAPGGGQGNVISGNSGDGIVFNAGSGSNLGAVTIGGNTIGLGADGKTALGNGFRGFNGILGSGIKEEVATETIGPVLIRQNIISSNAGDGITYASDNTTVQGNIIGSDISQTLDRGNALYGIQMVGDYRDANPAITDILIGGAAAGVGNLISANNFGGILIRNAHATVQGNYIGLQGDLTSPLGNSGPGIDVLFLFDALLKITVGGLADGTGNIIAYNAAAGVLVGASSVTIERNSIFKNGPDTPGDQSGLGIDLTPGGPQVTLNDPGDADTGPNGYQNFPLLSKVTVTSGNAEILGSLDSHASTTYRLEFFGNDALDPSNYGEGKTFLGATSVTTDASGHAAFDVTFPALEGALHVTSTATDPSGNTSEFSTSVGQLLNISTRLRVQAGDNALIGGFIVVGSDSKQVLVRGIGPSLGAVLGDVLADPILELHNGDGALLATNDNWKSDQQTEIEATGLQPTNDLESAIIALLPANAAYTAILRGKDGTTGIGLVEAYDLDAAANSKLANISTRGFVETGDNVMIGGFILGNGTADVIVRAIGPSLTSQGVADALQDPTLDLYDAGGMLIESNDDWKDTQQTEITATGLAPINNKESAILMTLGPGAYTAIVRGQGDTTGVGLVEIYNLN
ncbi:MAG: beta strand repeat-containing protein [Chthoniobacterales bacterium]